jgi:hypothetical protein
MHKLSLLLCQKRQFFADIIGENILRIITSVPGLGSNDGKLCVGRGLKTLSYLTEYV